MKTNISRHRLEELEHIIFEFQDQLFRFAFFRVGSLTDAQDIVQNTFLKMYDHTGDLPAINNLRNYFFKCISNSCNDYLRKNNKGRFIPLETAKVQTADDERNDLTEEYDRIVTMLSDIPQEQAEIIKMKTIDNLSFVEIADILGIPVSTVKSRFKYGIDKLRSKIN